MIVNYAFLFAVLAQLISCQDIDFSSIPPECLRPPPGVSNPGACCKIPQVFEDEKLSKCGVQKPDGDSPRPIPESDKVYREGPPPPGHPHHPRGPPPHHKEHCADAFCLLTEHGLSHDGETIDLEAAAAYNDAWAEKNPEFADAVAVANKHCLTNPVPGPPHVCEATRLMICFVATMYGECPTWEDTEECTILKEHSETCKPHFLPKTES